MDNTGRVPKILIVTSGILPVPAVRGGAVEKLVTDLLYENAKRRKAEITVVTVADERIQKEDCGEAHIIQVKESPVISLLDRITDKLQRTLHAENAVRLFDNKLANAAELRDFDIIVVENITGLAKAVQKKAEKSGCKARMFFHIHNRIDMYRSPSAIKELSDKGTTFLAVSDYLKNEVKKAAPDAVAATLYNGIDKNLMDPELKGKRQELREKYGIPSDKTVILYSGRIIAEKGILELVRAFAAHLEKNPDSPLCLVIAGGGVRADGNPTDYEKKVKEEIKRAGDRITVLGRVPYEHIPEIYAAADVLAVPTVVDEAFGMTVLEGMGMGLPVITTATGGIPEVLGSEDGYIRVSKEDLEGELEKALEKVCDKAYAPVLEEMGKRNREAFMKKEGLDRADYYDRFLVATGIAREGSNGHE